MSFWYPSVPDFVHGLPAATAQKNGFSEHDTRALIRSAANRGAHRQAISFFADLTQMFSWARKRQPWRALLLEGDPTELVDISPLIPADYEAERSRILS